MKKLFNKFKRLTMHTQMLIMYLVAVFIPIMILGIVIMAGNLNNLSDYHSGLMRTSNSRAKSVMYELTSQVYNVSDGITFDSSIIELFSEEYPNEIEFKKAVDSVTEVKKYETDYGVISDITIYTDQIGATDYRYVKYLGDEEMTSSWYKVAMDQYGVEWQTIRKENKDSGESVYNLSLIRKIPLNETKAQAILVIKVDYNYLRSRVYDEDYNTLIAVDDDWRTIIYDNERKYIGKSGALSDLNFETLYEKYEGSITVENESFMTYAGLMRLKDSDRNLVIATVSDTAYSNVNSIRLYTILIIFIAMLLPGIIMSFFIAAFSAQVNDMRKQIKKVSLGDYNMDDDFCGCYELNRAYADLRVMVENIKEKDAQMYAKEIAEQKLLNEQQKMEFQMLASQINPHFLYNTLEMIRMKAITAKDMETAGAIKLLGKSMRYVLDNTGTRYSTIAKELEHIENYLKIQQLRFEDRVNYVINNEDNLNLDKIKILPLLLQPIVENSILHGLEEVEHGGMITVSICRNKENEDDVDIIISDNGCGMDEKELVKMRKRLKKGANSRKYGIGLYNINQRIKICYGTEYGLSVDSVPGEGTVVTARISRNIV